MISVIIPTYNRRKVILRAINSILRQRFSEYEIIIIDDGSKDDTRSLIETINDNRVKYFYIENSGAANAKNYGVSKARYQYIMFLDSDDEIIDINLLLEVKKEIDNGVEFICFSRLLKKLKNREVLEKFNDNLNLKDYILKYPLNYPGKPPYIIKKSLYKKTGGLNITTKWGEAISFWRKLFLLNPKTKIINRLSYIYYLDGNDNISKGHLYKENKIDLVYDSILLAFKEVEKFLNRQARVNWKVVLLLISILKRSEVKINLKKLAKENIVNIIKAFLYVIYKRLNKQ